MHSIIVAAVALICLSCSAFAGEREHLKGLRSFQLVVEPPSSAATKCGITSQILERRIRAALNKSKLVLVGERESADAHIEVTLTAIEGCFINASVEVATFVRIDKSGINTMATVWRASGLGGQYAFEKHFDDLVRELVKDWTVANN